MLWTALPPAAQAAVADVQPLLEPVLLPTVRPPGWPGAASPPPPPGGLRAVRGPGSATAGGGTSAPQPSLPCTPLPLFAQVPEYYVSDQMLFSPAEDELLALGIRR